MKILCNGFPKTGNHALQKAIELLGQPVSVNHIPFTEGIDADIDLHLHVIRDPRDIVVSWLRHNSESVTPGLFISRFRKFQFKSLIEEMADYEGWLTDPRTIIIRYENLVTDIHVMEDIATFMNVPYLNGAWEELPGLTRTWNAVKSDHKSIWTSDVQKVWADEGGNELLKRWGY